MIKYILFDWSGTISNDFIKTYEIAMQVFEKFGSKQISIEKFRQDFDIPQETLYRKNNILESWDVLNGVFKEYWEKHEQQIPDLYLDARKILKRLKKDRWIGIVSAHHTEFLKNEISHHDLDGIFDYIEGDSRTKNDSIRAILQKFNIDKEQVIFIGDMKYDVQHGKKAGVKTGAIGTGYQSKETLLSEKPDYFFEDLADLYHQLSTSLIS